MLDARYGIKKISLTEISESKEKDSETLGTSCPAALSRAAAQGVMTKANMVSVKEKIQHPETSIQNLFIKGY